MTERWKPVLGFEGLYEVSDTGKVRSIPRQTATGMRGGRMLSLQELPPSAGRPYKIAHLYKGNRRKAARVHVLVLEAFVGPRPDGMDACHNNDIPGDNRLENLRWDTKSANQQDMIRLRGHWAANKTHCPQGHLLEAPNLVASSPGRRCWACSRESTDAWTAKRPFSNANADEKYKKKVGVN